MRKAALLALPLALSGCSGMGKFFHDTSILSGGNPNGPRGDSVNMRRVRGHDVAVQPILPEKGNMWPGSPQPLPTLKDVENPNSLFNRALGDPATYFGGASVDKNFMGGMTGFGGLNGNGPQIKSGQSLSAGETFDAHYGVSQDKSHILPVLPSSVPDNAARFMNKNSTNTIVIPNGDGTSTLIAPDGTVHVIRGTSASSVPTKKK